VLGVGVVRWSDLHDISCDKVDPFESSQDSTEFACGPATRLWSTGRRRN
jgi:hypothetical protein